MMNWKIALAAVAVMCLALPQTLNSTTVKYMDDEALTKNAEQIFNGKVLAKKSFWTKDNKRIYTLYKFLVTKKVKGKITQDIQVVKQWGGQVGNFKYDIAGLASYELNEQAFSFFTSQNKKGFRVTVGLAQGKLKVKKNKSGQRYLIRNTVGLHFKESGQFGNVQVIRSYDKFEKKIQDFVKKHAKD